MVFYIRYLSNNVCYLIFKFYLTMYNLFQIMPIETRSAARRNSQADNAPEPPSSDQGRATRRQGRGGVTDQGQLATDQANQPARVTRQAARGGRRGGDRGGHRGTIAREMRPVIDDLENDSFFDDPGHGEKLQARNGCLGTVSSRGWEARTNFLIDVYALINSSTTYKLKSR